ncbi:ATP synthase alpha chain precursor [Hirsutella rhossiliensis]|uniref:ATP synthase alpha chain n=1 Tax=Hirsutella rhossiliensis TaxID=111463 RepID=A0A9P8N466_9HYPO|nr:ATP synthase alpha chain precursor [Hirsutella rhossiliensis]KAH0967318.1 ATP synthase alpha chain precursor [Hirsutella rhossiliensis]
MGSAESKQVEGRLRQARLANINLPERFNMYYKGKSGLKVVLGESKSEPCSLVSMPGGWYGELILYNGPTVEAAPVAVVRSGRKMGFHDSIELAASRPEQQPTREELRCQSNGWSMSYAFVTMVDSTSLPEKFEWRSSRGDEVRGLGEQSYGWKLVWLSHQDEVVAVGTEAALSLSLSKAGAFQFVGRGASGELGDAWAVMAVVSFLRIVQRQMQTATTASV